MDDYTLLSHTIAPNITYLAIGSAYSIDGGPQQHPPFIDKLILEHKDFIFEIILIDPLMENPPEIVKYHGLNSVRLDIDGLNTNRLDVYEKNNIIVNVMRDKFSFDFTGEESIDVQKSKKILYTLINRTIRLKNENPFETYLLFVHDFSGYRIDKFSDLIWYDYQKMNNTIKYMYKKYILIDINNKIDASCFVDLNNDFFHPELITDSHGTMEIFNPFLLEDFDIHTILISAQKFRSSKIKILLLHAITYKLIDFSDNVLCKYRQYRLVQHDSTALNEKTSKVIDKLISITGFLDYFQGSLRENIFRDFIDFVSRPIMENPYEIIKKFVACQKNLESFILNLNSYDYFVHLNDLAINYITVNNKLPLFMMLLLQNK